MHVAYIRVSTLEQNEDRQLEAMKRYPIEKFFKEKISAKDMNRPELQKMLEFVREGDVVHIHDFFQTCPQHEGPVGNRGAAEKEGRCPGQQQGEH